MSRAAHLFQVIDNPQSTFSLENELSKDVLIEVLGKGAAFVNGQLNTEFITQARKLIAWIANNRKASFHVNRLLLEHGDVICPMLHEEMYGTLLKGIEQQIGFGKGVFMSTMMHMPERYARTQLVYWLRHPEALGVITTNLRQASLSNALATDKFSLAHDLSMWMESLAESVSVQKCLLQFDRERINKAGLSEALPLLLHIDHLCRSKAYMQAMNIAEDEQSMARVRKALAQELGSEDDSWQGLLSKLCTSLGADNYDSDTVLARYRAVGAVLLEHLNGMDNATRQAELIDDDLRLMAFKLGVEEVVQEMESPRHKRDVLIHDLAL